MFEEQALGTSLNTSVVSHEISAGVCHDREVHSSSIGTTEVDRVIDNAIALNQAVARSKQILIAASSDSHLFVHGDARSLVQAIDILLNSAVRFARPRSVVSLAVTQEHGAVVIRLWDEGRGYPLAGFAPRTSFGLGLRVARLVAERHGGTVSAAERAPGRGTVFKLTLLRAASR